MASLQDLRANRLRWRLGILGVLTVATAVSCSKRSPEISGKLPVFPVEGKVTAGGEPLVDADIYLHPVNPFPKDSAQMRPYAHVDSEGTFRVSTYNGHDGAPAGEYDVTISWRGPLDGLTEAAAERRPERLPKKYQSPKTSGLKAVVKEGENVLPAWDLGDLQRQASNRRY